MSSCFRYRLIDLQMHGDATDLIREFASMTFRRLSMDLCHVPIFHQE